jgi:hypothetical protein
MRNNNSKNWSNVSMRMAGGDKFFNELNKGMQSVRSSNVDIDKFLNSSNTSVDLSEHNRSPSSSVDISDYRNSPNSEVDLGEYNQSPPTPNIPDYRSSPNSGVDLSEHNRSPSNSVDLSDYMNSPNSGVDLSNYRQSPSNSVDLSDYMNTPNSGVDLSEYNRSPSGRNNNSPNNSVDTGKYFRSPPKPESNEEPGNNLDRFMPSPNRPSTDTSYNEDKRDPSNYRNPTPAPLPTAEYDSSRFESSPVKTNKPYAPSERVYTPAIGVDMDIAGQRFAALNTQNQNYKATVGANDAEGSLQRAKNHKANNDAILGNKDYIQQGLDISNAFINNGREQNPLDIEALHREILRSPLVARARAEYQGLLLYGDRYRHARERLPNYQSPQPLDPVERPDLGGISDDYMDRIDDLSI